jgi:hypothetical protein
MSAISDQTAVHCGGANAGAVLENLIYEVDHDET